MASTPERGSQNVVESRFDDRLLCGDDVHTAATIDSVGNCETPVRIRGYESTDADETLRIFQEAITVMASADYMADQIAAWARPGKRDLREWDQSMLARKSYVALIGEQVVGFSDVSVDGYIDMMFVAPRFARRGVASELMAFLELQARGSSARQLSANVSITARPFFEAHGFLVAAEQHPMTGGVVMTNFHMVKELNYYA